MFSIVFVDLDGTLLGPDGAVSPRNRAALEALRARGIAIVPASGRPPRMVRRLQRDLGLSGPAICYNGAFVSASPAGGALWERRLPAPVAAAVLDVLRAAGVAEILCEAADVFSGEVGEERAAEAERDGWDLRRDLPLDRAVADGAHKLVAICPSGAHPRLAAALHERLPGLLELTTSVPGADWLEIVSVGATKAAAAAEVGRVLGLDLSHAAAFGDGENDVALLARVGLGVAMADGDARAIAAAGQVAPPCQEDGLARAIEELLAG